MGYVQGKGRGKITYAFAGINRKTGDITPFRLKDAERLKKKAPSLESVFKLKVDKERKSGKIGA